MCIFLWREKWRTISADHLSQKIAVIIRNRLLLNTDNFCAIAKLLKNADLRQSDFEYLIDEAHTGDFVFADPPYTVRHNLNGFVKYNEKLFSWDDQKRLAYALFRAHKRGAIIVMTNACHSSIRELYQDSGFHVQTVSRISSISASAKSRKKFEELVISSHPT